MDHHLAGEDDGRFNGDCPMTVRNETSRIGPEIPRNRPPTSDPQLAANYKRRFLATCPSSRRAQKSYHREEQFKKGQLLYSLPVGNYDLPAPPLKRPGEPC